MTISDLSDDFTRQGRRTTPSITAILKEKRGLSASLPEVLGAVAISIGVLALVGFGIGAGVNYANDSGAKGSLESVKSAQILHQSKTGGFGTIAELTDSTAGATPALTSKPDNVAVSVSTDKRNYCALVESKSMSHTKFWLTSSSGKVLDAAPTGLPTGLTCPTAATTP